MYAFKIVTTTLDIFMICIIFFFMRGLKWEKEANTVIGFSIMQILYLMNLFCIWE